MSAAVDLKTKTSCISVSTAHGQRRLGSRSPVPSWTGIVSRIGGAGRWKSGTVDLPVTLRRSETGRIVPPVPVVARTRKRVMAGNGVEQAHPLPQLRGAGATCRKRHSQAAGDRRGLDRSRPLRKPFGTTPTRAVYVLGTALCCNCQARWPETFHGERRQLAGTVGPLRVHGRLRIHFPPLAMAARNTVPVLRLRHDPSQGCFAPRCLSCFITSMPEADLVVGYMGPLCANGGGTQPLGQLCWICEP